MRNKRELQEIVSNHSSDIELKNFMKLCKDNTENHYNFLVNDIILPSDNPFEFRENLIIKRLLVRKSK